MTTNRLELTLASGEPLDVRDFSIEEGLSELFEVRDGIMQILGAGAPVARRAGKHVGDFLQRQPARMEGAATVHHEANRMHKARCQPRTVAIRRSVYWNPGFHRSEP